MKLVKEFVQDIEELHSKILESNTVDDSYLDTRLEMTADTVYEILQDEPVTEEYRSDVRHAILEADYEQVYDLLNQYSWDA